MSAINPFATAEQLVSLWGRSGDAFLDAQRSLVQELASWMPAAADAAEPERARRAFARSWEAALDSSRSAAANLAGISDPAAREALDRILDPAVWFTQASSRVSDVDESSGPSRLSLLVEATMLVQRRSFEFDIVLVEAWMQATGAFARALNAASRQEADPISADTLAALWREHAEPIFAETERSDAFIRSRDPLAAATVELDAAQRAMGRIFGYASRGDLDEIRDRLDALRRQVAEQGQAPDPVATPPMPAEDRNLSDAEPARDRAPTTTVEPDALTNVEVAEADPAGRLNDDPTAEVSKVTGKIGDVGHFGPATGPPPRFVVRRLGAAESIGAPVVLIAPPPGEAVDEALIQALARNGRVALGVTWSDEAAEGSVAELTQDLATALAGAGSARLALVGIGVGGILAACHAAREPPSALSIVDGAFAFDDVDMSAPGAGWLDDIRRGNALMRGRLEIDGEPVDLATIACPILNLVGDEPDGDASRALAHLVSSDRYEERGFASRAEAGQIVAAWLDALLGAGARPEIADMARVTKSLEISAGLGHMGSAG